MADLAQPYHMLHRISWRRLNCTTEHPCPSASLALSQHTTVILTPPSTRNPAIYTSTSVDGTVYVGWEFLLACEEETKNDSVYLSSLFCFQNDPPVID